MKPESIQSRVLRGVGWSVAMQWGMRGLGLVSTLILARLLEPEDFGLVGMAMIVVGMVDAMFAFGVNTFLVQKSSLVEEDFHAAWTLRLCQGLAASLVLVVLTPFSVDYFADPGLKPVMLCLSATPILSALQNIRIVLFQKNLNMAKDFQFNILSKLTAFCLTVTCAVLLRNHWALVIGSIGGILASVVLSYVMLPCLPRVSLVRMREMISFSTWLWLRNIGAYFHTRVDQVFVGARLSSSGLGIYSMAVTLAELPTAVFLSPAGRALLPGFSMAHHGGGGLRKPFVKSFGLMVACMIPVNVGLAVVAEDLVLVMLGDKWKEAIAPLQIMAFVSCLMSLRYTASIMLTALGRVRFVAFSAWTQVILFVALCITFFAESGMVNIALIRLGIGACMTCLILGYIIWLGIVEVWDVLVALVRPVLACICMAAAIQWLDGMVHLPRVAHLVFQIVFGACVYGLSLFSMWWFVGQPESAESFVLTLKTNTRYEKG